MRVSSPLDPRRQERAVAFAALTLLGAAALTFTGERAAMTALGPAPVPSVSVRVRSSDYEASAPKPPPGSLTIDLTTAPLTDGSHLPQRSFMPSAPLPSEALAELTGSGDVLATFDVNLKPTAARYALSARGRCEGAPRCPLTLRLGGEALGSVELHPEIDLHTLLLDQRHIIPQGKLELVSERRTAPGKAQLSHLALSPLGPRVELAVGTPEARPYLVSGFYPDEADGNRRAAWGAGERSRFALVLAPDDTDYQIQLVAHAHAAVAPLMLKATLERAGEPATPSAGKPKEPSPRSLGEQRVGPGWGYVTFRVPRGALTTGVNQLTLHYPTTAKPSDTEPGSSDNRSLAVRYEWLRVSPIPR